MCTLSYLPLNEGYYVVNNRDESPLKSTTFQPEPISLDGVNILAPIDAEVKGTWIGVNDRGRIVCLMNGAHKNHTKKSSYRKSRGKVTLEFLLAADVLTYFHDLDLQGIEPFTLIIIDQENIKVFRWDEVKKYSEILNRNEPHNWSSSTLYDQEVAKSRATYFLSNTHSFNQRKELVLDWHNDRIQDSPRIILDRPLVKTISITTIEHQGNQFEMIYNDLIHQKTYTRHCEIKRQLHDAH